MSFINLLKIALVSEEMAQKLSLTYFVELALLVWHLPEGRSPNHLVPSIENFQADVMFCPWTFCFGSVKHVYGYEVVPQAISDARQNAKLNKITNAAFVQGDLNKIGENFGNNFPKPDIVISGYPQLIRHVSLSLIFL